MSADKSGSPTLRSRILKWVLIVVACLVVLGAIGVWNNNHFLSKPSRAQFNTQLDRSIESSTNWIVQHPDIYGNPPLMFMVGDMATMSGDPRLKKFVDGYLVSDRVKIPGRPITWYYAHWADPSVPLPVLFGPQVARLGWQDSWFAYATAPGKVELSSADRANMFSPDKYSWGVRLHLQLIALDIYLHFNGPSPQLDAALNPVTAGVARDAYYDFRVSDSYMQRSSYLLAAAKPDLIQSRWIDRIMSNQQSDGAWNYCWYGWCRGIFEFRFGTVDQGHSTVQGAWALYMLKYRYPEWIAKNYQ